MTTNHISPSQSICNMIVKNMIVINIAYVYRMYIQNYILRWNKPKLTRSGKQKTNAWKRVFLTVRFCKRKCASNPGKLIGPRISPIKIWWWYNSISSGQMESYFTNRDFPEIRGPISLILSHHLGWKLMWGRYKLTRYHNIFQQHLPYTWQLPHFFGTQHLPCPSKKHRRWDVQKESVEKPMPPRPDLTWGHGDKARKPFPIRFECPFLERTP